MPDGNELKVRFSCEFPWQVESDLSDNEIRIILTGGADENNDNVWGTGLASALLVIGLAGALAWLIKNYRERKEMMEMTEKAIMQHMTEEKIKIY